MKGSAATRGAGTVRTWNGRLESHEIGPFDGEAPVHHVGRDPLDITSLVVNHIDVRSRSVLVVEPQIRGEVIDRSVVLKQRVEVDPRGECYPQLTLDQGEIEIERWA